MKFKSISDLNQLIRSNLNKVPRSVDLVIGIPRSGLMAASLIALHNNLPLASVADFCQNLPIANGRTRKPREDFKSLQEAKHILLVDDSIASGKSMERAKTAVAQIYGGKITTLAIFATKEGKNKVDTYLEQLEIPRIFEWNLLHRPDAINYCVDIDGVLCIDPTEAENDDGEKYRHFLRSAVKLANPSYELGDLVTSRLEKYRAETEFWLAANHIKYRKLHMLDLPNAETRRKLGAHAKFKAEIYAKLPNAILFIESEKHQAEEISRLSGKAVLDYASMEIARSSLNAKAISQKATSLAKRARSKLSRILK